MKSYYNAGIDEDTKIRVKILVFSLNHSVEYLTE